MTKTGFKALHSLWGLDLDDEAVKPTVLNNPPPHLRCFHQQTKNHTAIHCIGEYNIMLFTDGCAVLSEKEWDAQLQK